MLVALCIILALAVVGLVFRTTNQHKRLEGLLDKQVAHERYMTVVDALRAAMNGTLSDDLRIEEALEDEYGDDVDNIGETLAFISALRAVDANLDWAQRQSKVGSVSSAVEQVRENIGVLDTLTKKMSAFLAFTPGNLIDQLVAFEKAGNIAEVKLLISNNLAALARILAPFAETQATMNQLGVSRAEVGIVEGDVMDTLLNVAQRLPKQA